MKIVKDYLLVEELAQIIETLKEKNSFIEKEIVKIGMVAQFCIDDFIENKEDLDCGEIYNLLVKEPKVYEDLIYGITNYGLIDDIMKKEESVVNLLKDFLYEISDKINNSEGSTLALTEAIEKLKELSDKNANI